MATTTKVIVQLHERTTLVAMDSDLQLRELGFISDTNSFRFNENGGTKHTIWMQDGTTPLYENTLQLVSGVIMTGASSSFELNALVADYSSGVSRIAAARAGASEGQLALYTTDSAGSTTEKVRIDGDGNVGINKTNPGYALDVGGSLNINGVFTIASTGSAIIDIKADTNNNDSTSDGMIRWYNNNGSTALFALGVDDSESDDLVLSYGTNTLGTNNIMEINDVTGAVRIVTSTRFLDTLIVDGLLTANDDIVVSSGTIQLEDSAVNHGLVSVLPTNTYGSLSINHSLYGGLKITGVSDDDDPGLYFQTYSYGGEGQNGFYFNSSSHDLADTVSDFGSDDYMFRVANNGTRKFVIKGDGSVGINRTSASYTLHVNGTCSISGVSIFTAQPIFSSLTASQAVFTDGSKGLVSNAITGTGNVVMSASPTLTGTVGGASLTLSGSINIGATTAITGILDDDTMAANSASDLVTQQSLVAYTSNAVDSSDLTGTLTITGLTTSPTVAYTAARRGNIVTIRIAAGSGTSNSTILTLTSLPSEIRPSSSTYLYEGVGYDNSSNDDRPMRVLVSGSGEIILGRYNGSGYGSSYWTNTGGKGLSSFTITYPLN